MDMSAFNTVHVSYQIWDINVKSTALLVKEAYPHFKANKSVIYVDMDIISTISKSIKCRRESILLVYIHVPVAQSCKSYILL